MYQAAVIGLGNIGLLYDLEPNRPRPSSHTLAYLLHPEIHLVAGADIRDSSHLSLRSIAPTAQFYTDAAQLLRSHAVDIVSICTPPQEHLQIIRRVLELSHVRIIFCEKPLLSDLGEMAELRSLLRAHPSLLIPNLSRRWSRAMQEVRDTLQSQRLGLLQHIELRYTRGIYNTGSHLFDLIRYFAGDFHTVQVVKKVSTSAEAKGDESFSFAFRLKNGVTGYAEAFDDRHYYMFEVDLYFTHGKIEIRRSGDEVTLFEVGEHPLFSGFKILQSTDTQAGLLHESSLQTAIEHIVDLLNGGVAQPICTFEDGLYPLFVANALEQSHQNGGSIESVVRVHE